ncbi:DUF2963 domain-containing protein [Paulownia witches'-broom phytoplasma]|uniref:DUF2963 domain-containing protein n=1 Tax=Paulownia witches'-broom phytoplasma TaxID=39647 RepID=UPI0021F316F5|nr:DUF2963 domain-containing protein [Paulownia witches'-broom phytoplasma]GLH60948.1 hypothetical protein PAWBP_6860 [Paulownia witches'-broom phytoplasma]
MNYQKNTTTYYNVDGKKICGIHEHASDTWNFIKTTWYNPDGTIDRIIEYDPKQRIEPKIPYTVMTVKQSTPSPSTIPKLGT